MSEPLFASVKATDDDDDEEKLAGDGGPNATSFHDDPQQANKIKKKKKKKSEIHEIDFDVDASDFSPVSLRDDDEENGVSEGYDTNNNDDAIRQKANKLINKRIADDTSHDSDDDRIFVGGGWGRHGSQFSFCPKGLCSCCSGRSQKQPNYSRGPPINKCGIVRTACALVAFLMLVLGAGYFGYEAGLPAEDTEEDGSSLERGEESNTIHYHGTRGEEWVEWIEREKEEIHLPHWNFTVHHKSDPAFKKPFFEPLAQSELLHLSENVFQSCSERSLLTHAGHEACLSFCHGHYCCFEKDPEFGSCVGEQNSYCFVYAACENVLGDFEMNNVALGLQAEDDPNSGSDERNNEPLNALDVELLENTCSKDNIETPEGLRDCSAFCKHNLCCFDEWEGESCYEDNPGYCEAYDSCIILVDILKEVVGDVDDENESGGDNGDETPIANDHSNMNANAGIEMAVKAVCGLGDVERNGDSWVAACRALCDDHLCCFSLDGGADGAKGSCHETYGEDVCNVYQECMVLGDFL